MGIRGTQGKTWESMVAGGRTMPARGGSTSISGAAMRSEPGATSTSGRSASLCAAGHIFPVLLQSRPSSARIPPAGRAEHHGVPKKWSRAARSQATVPACDCCMAALRPLPLCMRSMSIEIDAGPRRILPPPWGRTEGPFSSLGLLSLAAARILPRVAAFFHPG